ELIEYLIKNGASLATTTKAWQTPIDLVSTEEVRALLVECAQPITKDDKSTTIKEVGDSVSTDDIEENNGSSIPEESDNVDEEGTDTKEKREVKQLLMRTHQNLKSLRFPLITFWLKMMYKMM
ncbi:unnamed protein product, partial [Musa acuminata subsp. burmannicoides]